MPNTVKYNTSAESLALNAGDFWIGTGDVGKGPTSTTGFWNGINPPSSGYTIYQNKESQGPSIRVAADDAELIVITNQIIGSVFTTVAQCLDAWVKDTDGFVLNYATNTTITQDLALYLNASYVISYPQTDTIWYDISGNNRNGTLTNGPTFNSEGYLEFDGNNDYASVNGAGISDYSEAFSMGIWFRIDSTATWDNGYRSNIYSIAGSYTGQYGLFKFNDDEFGIQLRDANQTIYATVSGNSKGVWYNLVSTWDGSSTLKLYRNGELVATTISTAIDGSPDSTNLHIAGERAFGGAQGNVFKGDIASCNYYKKELSADEVLQNYYGAPNIPSGAKIIVNRAQNGVTIDSSGIELDLAQVYDNIQTWGYANSDLNGDFDGLTNFTYFLWLHCYSHHTNYSQTSFYKYAGTSTAVVRLYDFGNYNGNGDQANNRFYANRNGSWGSISGNFTMDVGETACICLQYDSTNGGDLWKNGVKISTGTGSGTIATNTSNLNIITPEYGGEQYVKVKESYVYTSTLTDAQIITLYNATNMKYDNGV